MTEAFYGEEATVFDGEGAFKRVRLARDGYLGWLRGEALVDELLAPTHRVRVLRAHAFAAPRVSAEPVLELALGVGLRVEGEHGDWLEVALTGGRAFVRKTVLEPLSAPLLEPTAAAITRLARAFMHAPYVWGGRSAWGLDCSGLVQTVYRAHGLFLSRDADQQQAAGAEVAPAEARAADLLFLPGHVMIALGERSFIHANAHNMRVTVDNFSTDDYGRGLWAELARVVRVRGLEGR
ncbi:C40 family peptidase [soil metagenome]